MFGRRFVLLALVLGLLATLPLLAVARAQTSPTPDQLAAQLLPANALPGWTAAGDVSTTINSSGTAGGQGSGGVQLTLAERVFKPADGDKAVLGIALLAPPSGTDLLMLGTALQDGSLMRQLANGATQGNLSDLTLTGDQDLGEQDQSATFTGTVNGMSLQFASVVWVRNGEVAFTLFGADATQVDPQTALGQAVDAAQLEDAVLQSGTAGTATGG